MVGPAAPVRGSGQWFSDGRGPRWWFDSGSLALDLAHTGLVAAAGVEPGPQRAQRRLHSAEDLDAWLTERLPCSPAGERDLSDALVLRGAVAALVVAAVVGAPLAVADVDVVNLFAATPDVPPRLDGGALQAGRGLARPGQALSTVARDAVAVLSGQVAGQLRVCDALDCALVYLDTTRALTRRWCSMQRCGNRHKVRAHRARLAAAR